MKTRSSTPVPHTEPERGSTAELGSNDEKERQSSTSTLDAPVPVVVVPEGGFEAWYQVLSSFCLFLNSWGLVNSFGVYQTYYESSLLADQASSSAISWIGSVQAFLLVFAGLITGPLFDAGYYCSLVLSGAFLVVFGTMMTSLCTAYWQLILAQGVVVGLGSSCLFVPSVAILPRYFAQKKAIAQSIAVSGSSVGGVIYPIIFHELQPRLGFGWATRITGFVMLATFGVSVVGLVLFRPSTPSQTTRQTVEWRAWREWPFTLFAMSCFFAFMGLYVPFFYIGLRALDLGTTTRSLAFYLLTIMNATSTLGRILPGLVADKIGPMNTIIPCVAVSIVLAFSWLAISSSGGLVAFSSLYGFFSGCFVSLPPTVIVTLSPSMEVVGARMGMCFGLAALGLLLGNPVAGAILGDEQGQHNWTGLIVWSGVCNACACFCLLGSRTAKVGLDWRLFA